MEFLTSIRCPGSAIHTEIDGGLPSSGRNRFLGSTHPPSSLSSPFWGHKICLSLIARIIMTKTNNQTNIKKQVMTHPTIWIAVLENDLPTAKVAVIKAVLGKTKEYHAMVKVSFPGPIQDTCAKADTRNSHNAKLQFGKLRVFSCSTSHFLVPTYPHSQSAIQSATTFKIVAVIGPSPMKSFGNVFCKLFAMLIVPATVKALGPTDTNIPGLKLSCGSFCVLVKMWFSLRFCIRWVQSIHEAIYEGGIYC